MTKVNVAEKLSKFSDHWSPKIIGELNGQHVKLAKLLGDFLWHKHEDEDEMFYILSGTLRMDFRDHSILINPGEFLIVPKGIEHKPYAEKEVSVMLFEPISTKHTGEILDKRTVTELNWI